MAIVLLGIWCYEKQFVTIFLRICLPSMIIPWFTVSGPYSFTKFFFLACLSLSEEVANKPLRVLSEIRPQLKVQNIELEWLQETKRYKRK